MAARGDSEESAATYRDGEYSEDHKLREISLILEDSFEVSSQCASFHKRSPLCCCRVFFGVAEVFVSAHCLQSEIVFSLFFLKYTRLCC